MSKLKSRKKRIVFVKTPSGRIAKTRRQRKPQQHKCGMCGKLLQGIPRLVRTKFKNLPKTKKRPQRPYGGVLCGKCMKKKLSEEVIGGQNVT